MVGFSLASGRVLYASEQAPSILCCRRKFLQSAKFVELLFHQDVNVFYSHTAQPHLPPWSHAHTGVCVCACVCVCTCTFVDCESLTSILSFFSSCCSV